MSPVNEYSKYKLVKSHLSGGATSIYSVEFEYGKINLFDRFIQLHVTKYRPELANIIGRIRTIGNRTGAKEIFFKGEEGIPGDQVCALYDDIEGNQNPKHKLRLYCVRLGSGVLILGGGGEKNSGAYQDYPLLVDEVNIMKTVSQQFLRKIQAKEIIYIQDGRDIDGDLNFNQEVSNE